MHRAGGQRPCARQVSRRWFIEGAAALTAGLALGGCSGRRPSPMQPVHVNAPPPPAHLIPVAIAHTPDYDRSTIARRVRDLLDGIGGLGGDISHGDRVAVKVNLTGGVGQPPLPGVSAEESYVTHPEVVRALVPLLFDAGAREVFIVEAVYEWESYRRWGYEELAEATGATLIDLNAPRPYDDLGRVPVGEGSHVYGEFLFNRILREVDAFVSVAKMKNHWDCGVTHALKNLVGLVPAAHYRLNRGDNYRSAFHGRADQTRERLPRVVVDLARARPIHLALIDGVRTTQGGEGPWIETISPTAPGVLVAARDPVSADAVATAIMGYDPVANYPTMPFVRCENHLNLARQQGLGTNRLEEIRIVGPAIADVLHPFSPGWR